MMLEINLYSQYLFVSNQANNALMSSRDSRQAHSFSSEASCSTKRALISLEVLGFRDTKFDGGRGNFYH